MANFLNQPNNPNIGGFRHYSGLLPVQSNLGDRRTSIRIFHLPTTEGNAVFRGDIVTIANASSGADLPANISAPSASVVIGNGGGSGLGNAGIAPNVARYAPGTNLTVAGPKVAGVVVGFGPITLYMAKNGYQYRPANQEAWVFVDTDADLEMYVTQPTANVDQTNLFARFDVAANAGFQSTRFGISGLSMAGAVLNTAPLQLLSTGEQIGNDPTAAGSVARVKFHPSVHMNGNGVLA